MVGELGSGCKSCTRRGESGKITRRRGKQILIETLPWLMSRGGLQGNSFRPVGCRPLDPGEEGRMDDVQKDEKHSTPCHP